MFVKGKERVKYTTQIFNVFSCRNNLSIQDNFNEAFRQRASTILGAHAKACTF